MAIRDLIPWSRTTPRTDAPAGAIAVGQTNPLAEFRQQMDRLFDDFLSLPVLGGGWRSSLPTWPSVEVKENDDSVTVTAELAGLSEKDVEVSVDDGVLTLRGEKRSTSEDKDRGWSERYYGRFERSILLPDGADEEKCDAQFSDGVLTVTMPKSESKKKSRRIPIRNGAGQG